MNNMRHPERGKLKIKGDVAWYLALLATALGVSLQDILMHNNREENNVKASTII